MLFRSTKNKEEEQEEEEEEKEEKTKKKKERGAQTIYHYNYERQIRGPGASCASLTQGKHWRAGGALNINGGCERGGGGRRGHGEAFY